jgi:hypothetical protein
MSGTVLPRLLPKLCRICWDDACGRRILPAKDRPHINEAWMSLDLLAWKTRQHQPYRQTWKSHPW